MGRKRPVISSVTETAAGDESPDESERPPPVIMAENSGADESPHKKNGRKSKPKAPIDIAPTRASKRARKPTVHYDDQEYDDYFTKFKAQNKRRRIKQEIENPEDGDEGNSEGEEEKQDQSTSGIRGRKSVAAAHESQEDDEHVVLTGIRGKQYNPAFEEEETVEKVVPKNSRPRGKIAATFPDDDEGEELGTSFPGRTSTAVATKSAPTTSGVRGRKYVAAAAESQEDDEHVVLTGIREKPYNAASAFQSPEDEEEETVEEVVPKFSRPRGRIAATYPDNDEGEEPGTSFSRRTSTAVATKSTPTTSTKKSKETLKTNVKVELQDEEEPDIIPLDRALGQQSKRKNHSSQEIGSLYASANSQEKFRRAIASSSASNQPLPYRQYASQSDVQFQRQQVDSPYPHQQQFEPHLKRQQDGPYPRVIVPRSIRNATAASAFQMQQSHNQQQHFQQPAHNLLQQPLPQLHQAHNLLQQQPLHQQLQQHSPLLPPTNKPTYRPIIGSYGTNVSNPSLPQYQDKRMKHNRENEPVQCPDCNLVLKNLFSYNTHRNYVHGQVQRAKIPCPESGCIVMSNSMIALVRHLNSGHRYCLRHEQHVFKDEDEYMDWYRNLVQDGSVSFVRSSGFKSQERYNGTVSLMFYCNNTGRKHLNNRAGTIRMNAVCPAYFRMTKHQSGHVSVYGQLRHVGHECKPTFKTIESYPVIRQTMTEIELAFASFKALTKTTIPADYPMEHNSLISSCLDVLRNIKTDFDRARILIDGIVPGVGMEDESYPSFDEELMKSAADEDLFALPNPQDTTIEEEESVLENSQTPFSSSRDNIDEEVQIIKDSIYNSAAKLEKANAAAAAAAKSQVSPPQIATPSPPPATDSNSLDLSSSSGKAGTTSSCKSYDEERINEYRKNPVVLTNGRIQCTLCSVILKTFESYTLHRQTQHGLKTKKRTPTPQQPSPIFADDYENGNAFDGQNRKPCSVCQQSYTTSNPNKILFCKNCKVTFHDGCKGGHMAVCPSNAPYRL